MNPVLKETIDQIASGAFSPGNRDLFRPIVDSLLNQDTYLVLADFQAYLECQHKADKAFLFPESEGLMFCPRAGCRSLARPVRLNCNCPG